MGSAFRKRPTGYPLRIDWDGILVDDPDHDDDIVRRVRDVLELIWKDRADAIEREACESSASRNCGTTSVSPATGGFWDDHVSGTPRAAAKPRSTGRCNRRRRTTPSGSTTTGSTRTSSSKPW